MLLHYVNELFWIQKNHCLSFFFIFKILAYSSVLFVSLRCRSECKDKLFYPSFTSYLLAFFKDFLTPFSFPLFYLNRFPCEAVAKVRLCFLFPNFTSAFLKVFSRLVLPASFHPFLLLCWSGCKSILLDSFSKLYLYFFISFFWPGLVRSQGPSYLTTKARLYIIIGPKLCGVGGDLLSHLAVVPSALWSLTSLFGMGRGGASMQ